MIFVVMEGKCGHPHSQLFLQECGAASKKVSLV